MADIMSYPGMKEYLDVFYSRYLLEMYPEELYREPIALAEQFAKTPWGEPFSVIADQLMDAVNLIADITENHTRKCISLWEGEDSTWNLEKEARGGKSKVFLLSPVIKEKNPEKKPAVIICPGGGYEEVCFSGEGNPMMHFMEAQGFRVFVLRYRVSPERYPAPQEDLALAVRYVRAHKEEYGVDAENVTAMGFSAGGHLCAFEAVIAEKAGEMACEEIEKDFPKLGAAYRAESAKPDKLVLGYPVISFVKEQHEGSFQGLTGGEERMREACSVEKLVTEDYPPTFIWACEDDDCVPPSNTRRMGEALEEKGVRHEVHLYPTGGHGCGLAFSKSAYDWSRAMAAFLKK